MKVSVYELALTFMAGYVGAMWARPDWGQLPLVAVGIFLWAAYYGRRIKARDEAER